MGADWAGTVLYPEYLLAALVLVVVVVDALFWPRRPSGNLGYFTLCGVLLVLSAALQEWTYGNSGTAFDDLVFLDTYATFFDILVLAVALCALLLALGDAGSGPPRGEYYPLLLLSTLGMMLTASAADLIVVYLGLELASLPLWALAALGRRDDSSAEAAIKFLLPGLFASGLILFGTALLYGAVGGTGLQLLVESLSSSEADPNLVAPGVVLLLAGLLCKAGAAPFHAWAPDVREGAPPAISAFIAAALPAAACAALGRVVLYGLAPAEQLWQPLLEVVAGLSMVGGSLMALNQRSIRRLLAYVAIAQVGCGLVGLLAANEAGVAALLFWLATLALALVGGYAVLAMCRPDNPHLRDLEGLAQRQPLLALGFALCLASLAGLPPTAGFVGRLYLLHASLEAGNISLALLAAGCFPLLFYACARTVVSMFMRRPSAEAPPVVLGAEALVVLLLSGLGTLGLGLMPSGLLRAVGETVVAVM